MTIDIHMENLIVKKALALAASLLLAAFVAVLAVPAGSAAAAGNDRQLLLCWNGGTHYVKAQAVMANGQPSNIVTMNPNNKDGCDPVSGTYTENQNVMINVWRQKEDIPGKYHPTCIIKGGAFQNPHQAKCFVN